ncbi:MAG: glycoside hydrolase family 31 protein [Anaerolineales bacterium]
MPNPSFELQFSNDPWSCRIHRKAETLLQVLSDYHTRQEGTSADTSTFSFESCTLTVIRHPEKISYQFLGKDICVRIPLTGHWYGGGALINQHLRWNEIMLPLTEFITDDNGPTGLTTVLTPAWLNSQGLGLRVLTPFNLGFNQPPASIIKRQKGLSKDLIPFEHRPFLDHKGVGDGLITLVGDDLQFEILLEEDILSVYRALQGNLGRPHQTPSLELLGAPIWTTWARYKDRIDQETVLQFTSEIRGQGYPYHVLEIDDRWQSHYGDLEFDPQRFPDPAGMIEHLHQQGFQVTAWVMPFFNPHSQAGAEAAQAGYLVRDAAGDPYRIMWWQGAGYLLDVTNPAALEWYKRRLDEFQAEVGLDGYKFDAGEAKFVPPDGVFHSPLTSRNDYTHRYIRWIGENFSFCEVRSGWLNQDSPLFFRIWDLWSLWGFENGLRSIIPTTLTMALTGYPFVFPDMIGGNAYFHFPANKLLSGFFHRIVIPILESRLKNNSPYPEEEALGLSDVPSFLEKSVLFGYPTPELIVRWTQANVFLQVMQFSLAPWDFGEETNRICRQFAELHLEFVPLLEKFARLAVETGEPIIRPVFWMAPKDERALVCEDQFLVGDELLVAPVLYPRKRSREIYFPPGHWRDHWTGEVFSGPTVVRNYPAPLDILPFFIHQGAE